MNNEKIKLQLWDTAGQERFRTLTTIYYRNVDAIFIVCEFGSRKSFEDVKNFWWNEVQKNADADSEKVVIVNKVDLNNKELDLTDVKRWCDSVGINFYIVSAKTGEGIEDAFLNITKIVIGKRKKHAREQNRGTAGGYNNESRYLGNDQDSIHRLSYNAHFNENKKDDEESNCC